ncbi:hypothetical protein L9G15_05065, partial [Shewanella sp. A3A]|nr:hypothetical protein [Shewanella ferrihydritica]
IEMMLFAKLGGNLQLFRKFGHKKIGINNVETDYGACSGSVNYLKRSALLKASGIFYGRVGLVVQ